MILPQCDGPYLIDTMRNDHAVRLVDVLSGDTVMGGKRVATSRLIKFHFPAEYANQGDEDMQTDTHDYKVGEFVLVDLPSGRGSAVHVCKIVQLFQVGEQAQVSVYEVPNGERYGLWRRRPWKVTGAIEVVGLAEILMSTDLINDALPARTLDLLAPFGINVSEPNKEKTLIRK
ncbi:unnamed protein product [Polarella glacialis]|uniref:Uncharacterized protein n=1 Tax=Polarella glacialis TaxID=89957 RepID=A0A813DCM2_POLGL|nr:unnamed protein product [Polarella glacialis]